MESGTLLLFSHHLPFRDRRLSADYADFADRENRYPPLEKSASICVMESGILLLFNHHLPFRDRR